MFEFADTGYEIIDAHIHPYCAAGGTDFTVYGKTPEQDFMAVLKRSGITGCAGSPINNFRTLNHALCWDDIHQLNLVALKIAAENKGFYMPGIHVHPAFPAESVAEVEEMFRNHGVRLIGELVAYMMQYNNYAVPELDSVWEFARDNGMAVNLHLNSLQEPQEILKKFPTLKLIIAHPSASPAEFTARMELVARYPNAALDFSGSGPNMWHLLREGIRIAGAEKLIFGTDFPIRNPGMYVAGVLGEHLSDSENRLLFAENFKRMLSI